jgi:hypothetical protein
MRAHDRDPLLSGCLDSASVLAAVQAAARRLRRCSLRSQPGQRLRALPVGAGYARRHAGLRGSTNMALQVAELSIQLIEALQPLMHRIKAKDKSLEDQIRRAASSIALNIGEAEFSDPGNRRARFHTAAGSAGWKRSPKSAAFRSRNARPRGAKMATAPDLG